MSSASRQLRQRCGARAVGVELTHACSTRSPQHERARHGACRATRRRAGAAAERRRRSRAGATAPLLGVPIAHKDIFVTRGWKSTAGSRMLANTAVRSMRPSSSGSPRPVRSPSASSTATNSPWARPTRTPSSGRSAIPGTRAACPAARRAARLRRSRPGWCRAPPAPTPAARCASRRRCAASPASSRPMAACSRYGMIAFASSLDQGGVHGAQRRGLRAAARRHGGFDARDSTSLERPAEDFLAAAAPARRGASSGKPLAGLRIGLPREFFGERWPRTCDRPCVPRWRDLARSARRRSTCRCRAPSCRSRPTT